MGVFPAIACAEHLHPVFPDQLQLGSRNRQPDDFPLIDLVQDRRRLDTEDDRHVGHLPATHREEHAQRSLRCSRYGDQHNVRLIKGV